MLAAAAAARVWGAWAGRLFTEPDETVVGLMAKHMAEGTDWPMFFYGQSYMGSLEPMASTVFVKFMGATGFAVGLGTALWSVLALWALWQWGTSAGGAVAGFWSLALGAVGGAVYFQYQTAARGGYMTALWIGATAIWLAARWGARWWDGARVRKREAFALGALAGLGLWNNMITAAALGTAGLLALVGIRGRFWRHWKALFAGAAGGMLGAAPWIGHMARNGVEMFGVMGIGKRVTWRETLWFVRDRFLTYQTMTESPRWAFAMAVTALLLSGAGVWVLMRDWKRTGSERRFAGAGAVAFCGIFLSLYMAMGFASLHTSRYLLPLGPGLAVLGGMAAGWAAGGRWWRAFWGTAAAGLVAAECWWAWAGVAGNEAERRGKAERWALLTEDALACGAEAVMAPLQDYALNFTSGEKVAVSDGRQGFYEPTRLAAEMAERVAYMKTWKGVPAFLERMGVPFRVWKSGIVTTHGLAREKGGEWGAETVAEVRSDDFEARAFAPAEGRGAREALLDRDENTMLVLRDGWDTESAGMEIAFRAPIPLTEVRLQFDQIHPGYLHTWIRGVGLEVKEGGKWRRCGAEEEPVVPLDWSVGRVFASNGDGASFPLEGVEAAEALRVTIGPKRRVGTSWPDWRWGVAEILLFGGGDEEEKGRSPEEAVDELGADTAWWEETAYVMAPRWAANRLWKRWGIPAEKLTGLNPRIFPMDGGGSVPVWVGVEYGARRLDGRAFGVLSERRYAKGTRRLLERIGLSPEVRELGPFTLFHVGPHEPKKGLALEWCGHYPLLEDEEQAAADEAGWEKRSPK